MCTPASSWLTIFTVLPTPAASPSRHTLLAIASSTGWALANASSEPDAITVIVPPRAPTAPPETGASSISRPASVSFASSVRAASGATVVQHSTTAPGVRRARQPASPNSTSFAWAALTTNTTRASSPSGRSAAAATAVPPAAVSSARPASRNSQPDTSWPACTRLSAAPIPIEPRPITPTRMVFSLVSGAGCPRIGLRHSKEMLCG